MSELFTLTLICAKYILYIAKRIDITIFEKDAYLLAVISDRKMRIQRRKSACRRKRFDKYKRYRTIRIDDRVIAANQNSI